MTDLPQAPPPVTLKRLTPKYSVHRYNGGVRGECEGCGWTTAVFSSAGFLASIFAAHGQVIDTSATIPLCPETLERAA